MVLWRWWAVLNRLHGNMSNRAEESSEYLLDNIDDDGEENDRKSDGGSISDADGGDVEDPHSKKSPTSSPFSSQQWPKSYWGKCAGWGWTTLNTVYSKRSWLE